MVGCRTPREKCKRDPQPPWKAPTLPWVLWLQDTKVYSNGDSSQPTTAIPLYSKWIKTTASSPLEKFASDCLNQNGDLSQVASVQYSELQIPVKCFLFFPYHKTSFLLHLPAALSDEIKEKKIPQAARWRS